MASCGSLQVVAEFARSAVKVTSCPAPDAMNPGDTQTINVGVANRNTKAASLTIEIVDGNGNVLGSRSVNLSGGASRSYGVEFTAPSSTGEYEINANTVDVVAADSASMSASTSFSGASLDPRNQDTGTLATVGAGIGALGISALTERR